jgi:hypothetical protein
LADFGLACLHDRAKIFNVEKAVVPLASYMKGGGGILNVTTATQPNR